MVIQEDVIPRLKKYFCTRNIIVATAAFAIAVALTSCGLAFNEGNGNPNGNMKLNDGGASCIEYSLPKIERYFKGTASVQDTNESWTCLRVNNGRGPIEISVNHPRLKKSQSNLFADRYLGWISGNPGGCYSAAQKVFLHSKHHCSHSCVCHRRCSH